MARPPIKWESRRSASPELMDLVKALHDDHGAVGACKLLGISSNTLYRVIAGTEVRHGTLRKIAQAAAQATGTSIEPSEALDPKAEPLPVAQPTAPQSPVPEAASAPPRDVRRWVTDQVNARGIADVAHSMDLSDLALSHVMQGIPIDEDDLEIIKRAMEQGC